MFWKSSPPKELSYQAHWLERFLLTTSKTRLILTCFVATFIPTCMVENYYGMQAGIEEAREDQGIQNVRSINLLLFSYAQDHDGKYPTGKSSTEIFQKLLDGKYASDPTIFYLAMPGKTKPEGSKLKPENVCWDVTNGILPDDSDDLPVVFSTGYKVAYLPGTKISPLAKASPNGIAVAYKNNGAIFMKTSWTKIDPFIRTTFDPKGRTYQQLTPDGPLP